MPQLHKLKAPLFIKLTFSLQKWKYIALIVLVYYFSSDALRFICADYSTSRRETILGAHQENSGIAPSELIKPEKPENAKAKIDVLNLSLNRLFQSKISTNNTGQHGTCLAINSLWG
jgi:hypothetical protein